MSSRRPQTKRFPTYLRRAFDAIAEETRVGPIVLVVRDRGTRRVYWRAIAKRGGIVANLVFSVTPNASDALADELRVRVGERCEIVNVRELRPGGGQG